MGVVGRAGVEGGKGQPEAAKPQAGGVPGEGSCKAVRHHPSADAKPQPAPHPATSLC